VTVPQYPSWCSGGTRYATDSEFNAALSTFQNNRNAFWQKCSSKLFDPTYQHCDQNDPFVNKRDSGSNELVLVCGSAAPVCIWANQDTYVWYQTSGKENEGPLQCFYNGQPFNGQPKYSAGVWKCPPWTPGNYGYTIKLVLGSKGTAETNELTALARKCSDQPTTTTTTTTTLACAILKTEMLPEKIAWSIQLKNGTEVCKSAPKYSTWYEMLVLGDCCLPTGNYILKCQDTYGEGWAGGYIQMQKTKYCGNYTWDGGNEFVTDVIIQ